MTECVPGSLFSSGHADYGTTGRGAEVPRGYDRAGTPDHQLAGGSRNACQVVPTSEKWPSSPRGRKALATQVRATLVERTRCRNNGGCFERFRGSNHTVRFVGANLNTRWRLAPLDALKAHDGCGITLWRSGLLAQDHSTYRPAARWNPGHEFPPDYNRQGGVERMWSDCAMVRRISPNPISTVVADALPGLSWSPSGLLVGSRSTRGSSLLSLPSLLGAVRLFPPP